MEKPGQAVVDIAIASDQEAGTGQGRFPITRYVTQQRPAHHRRGTPIQARFLNTPGC